MTEDIDRLTDDVAVLLAEMERRWAIERAKKRRADELEIDQARIRHSKQDEIPVVVLS